ncbi:glycoside hydrolase family 3 N-terminal domain-containing protein [Dysgonomonas sp. BGC7]|uniref:glycoside hydrolase family 3 N-terminal domain-containing protein n=1 Tax=Dysgonomonas sp. BGC7 TaxID=1658008 RepID=UPI00068364C0|nr:glycoside hydrolase family 3 N-terminal domain-containing protein [Dysgonomonas sp. BGC7]MBD8389312.1 glycoside hydrolase family 3 C-terminal domain-containing protein [Dysgonomonas sp. BGC7]
MKTTIYLFCILFFSISSLSAQQSFKYKDPTLSVEERTKDLLRLMTLEEKIGQLLCPLGWEMYEKKEGKITHSAKFEEYVSKQHIGMLWATYRADPWTKKTLENGLTPAQAAEAGNVLQRYVMENTRLGIPVFLAEEAPHGHMAIGTTVFPSGIGQAATWNPSLVEKMGEAISKEIRLQGGHISYGPVLDLSRDPRWSRVEESFGEDPVLTAEIGAAIVRGTGKGNIRDQFATIATLKHFTAYGIPEGGHNGNTATVGPRELLDNFLPPFKKAIEAGALSIMTAYNSIDGVPCTSNKYLLTDILRDDWKFRGFSVSDLGSIEGIHENHAVASSVKEASTLAINAGLDADLGGKAYLQLIDAVREGKVQEAVIDTAVCRILRLKFEMGLFDNPYVDSKKAATEVRNDSHVTLARKVAQESIVLLKNENGTLPLSKKVKIALIGPNADNIYNMLGDYTAPQETKNIKTVLDGLKSKTQNSRIEYVKGCAIRDTANLSIDEAVAAAKRADIAIVVVGGSSARDFKTKYIETGAAVASEESVSDMESGEGFDRSTLDLLGKQEELLKAIKETGKPMIVIYIQGRPLNMNWAADNAQALLTAWYPGQEGGLAIADVLFGDYNPAGRLPISVPRSVGQIPVYYNRKNPWGHNYVEITSKPLYTFGYGLSYSSFEYKDLKITEKGESGYTVSLKVKNAGLYDGDEVVQLYIRDEFASVVQPVKQLKHFERVKLKKGETKNIVFSLSNSDLSIINEKMERIVEPGTFSLLIGASADDIRLEGKLNVK